LIIALYYFSFLLF